MSCDWANAHLDDYELGTLPSPDRDRLEAHLAACAGCRAHLARMRSADEAIRAALAWAEPDPGFAARVAARAARPARHWRLVAAAAAAIVLCGVAIYATRRQQAQQQVVEPAPASPAQRLLAGALRDAYGRPVQSLEDGRMYVAAAPAAIDLVGRSVVLLGSGTRFVPRPDASVALCVSSGDLLGQVDAGRKETSVELAPELGGAIVRSRGCEFYSRGAPLSWLERATAQGGQPEEIRVHVFAGTLELVLGSQRLVLQPGDSAIIAGGVSAGGIHALQARIGELRLAIGEEALATRCLYRWLRDMYAQRLLELRSATAETAPPYLAERLALVEGLMHAHARTLARLEAERPELFELDAAEAELWRLDDLTDEAHHAYERLLAQTATAG